jgi:hypothetical protein
MVAASILLMIALGFALAFSKSCRPDGKQKSYYTNFRTGHPTLVVPPKRLSD